MKIILAIDIAIAAKPWCLLIFRVSINVFPLPPVLSDQHSVLSNQHPVLPVQPLKAIAPSWFARPAEMVAPELVGCRLVRQLAQGKTLQGLIVETEAYGPTDPACHGFRGKTARNAVMFGPAGVSYVYFIYGRYYCLNVVCDRPGIASAVLIRALWLPCVPQWINRGRVRHDHQVAAGPGRLCRALEIDRSLDGLPFSAGNDLRIAPRSADLAQQLQRYPGWLQQTTRIGLTKAKDWPWRWYLAHCPAVSRLPKRDR